ncbi:MAG TPA: CobW family GTP-binding protein [Burkholderiales bacterium]|nr:CobW family GTP-binding protein [Burkholderiales bacterium]
MPAPQTAPLPVTLIGGYLGAGKTTLVNHLLRQAGGRRLAVLVNDFGELPIDADLIEADDGEVLSLAGGCICCSFGNDLMAALMKLPARRPRPDHVLLEASGVALPGAVAAALSLLADVALDAVVVLADADSVQARAADRYLADTIERQLRAADLLVLNKVDLVSARTRSALHAWLATLAPGAKVIDAVRGRLPLEAVLGIALGARQPADSGALRSGAQQPVAAAEALFEHLEMQLAPRVDARALGAALAEPALGVIRAKGILRDRDGAAIALQLVGTRAAVEPLAGAGAAAGRLVCIGLKGRLDRAAIVAAVNLATAPARS